MINQLSNIRDFFHGVLFSAVKFTAILLYLLLFSNISYGETTANEEPLETSLARQLTNPIASLASVPIQLNYDQNIGADDRGSRYTINIQPVIPMSLNSEWNIISRTIIPIISQESVFGSTSQFGLSDTLQSFFFSPKSPTDNGWIYGAGVIMLIPTGTDQLLSTEKFGIGPTAVGLRQTVPWTYGVLINHVNSVAGNSKRADVSATFFQPFISYTTTTATSFNLNSESTYDWEGDELGTVLNFNINQVARINTQLISFGAGVRYWATPTDAGPERFGFRTTLTFLFPR